MEKIAKKPSALNPWHLAAAILMLLTTVIHVVAGGMDIYSPLRNAEIDAEVKSTLSVLWHVTTLLLVGFSASLFWLSKTYSTPLACFIGLGQIGFAAIFMGYSFFDTGNLTFLPQWTVFATGALLMGVGHWRAM